MITHIVFFKMADRNQESVEKVRDVLLNMKGKIECLKYIEVGVDVLHSQRSFDVALITKFDSMEDLDAYQIHPVHVGVKEFMKTAAESSVTVDYISE